ncbi:TIGR03084 family metal-binding protein [Desulfitobacterium chlororespirans]|uniref:TIGR03084 family protein n=1 Tax=Desulfitobacterium chlororespirans DSM 11544 TaxID=1121395 RepID=A0A1M7UAS7_9FIRM|nr:TIGR03084 family metal-binding protein [Desulfitobacterium chlororespirans]SHN80046.1 TIGR03084 family protein [Desulfitobacterium chlororespirans DSM 11544]
MKAILNDLLAEQSLVDSLVDNLTEQQWQEVIKPMGLQEEVPGLWTIKDEIIHIALFDEAAGKLILGEAESLGDANPPGTHDEFYRCPEKRNMSKAEVLSWWRQVRTKMNWALYNSDPKARIPWAPNLPMAAKSLASARLMELWAHSTDVYDHLKIPVKVAERIVHTLFLSWQARPNSYRIHGVEMPDTPIYLELVLPSGQIWSKGTAGAQQYIKGKAEDWAMVAIRRRNWLDTDLVVVGDEAERYASFVQTYAGKADEAPPPQRMR